MTAPTEGLPDSVRSVVCACDRCFSGGSIISSVELRYYAEFIAFMDALSFFKPQSDSFSAIFVKIFIPIVTDP